MIQPSQERRPLLAGLAAGAKCDDGRVSLTGHLRDRRGPVREWFATQFPATRALATETNRVLRGSEPYTGREAPRAARNVGLRVISLRAARGGSRHDCPVPPPPGSDSALVGTAAGYIVTAWLCPKALQPSVATRGALSLDEMSRGRPRELPSVACARAVQRIMRLRPAAFGASRSGWAEVCQLTIVLARCEQWFRSGHEVWQHMQPLVTWRGGQLPELAGALANSSTLADLDNLGRAVLDDLGHLSSAGSLRTGATFAQSCALGGADADLIADGQLLELKTAAQARIAGRFEFWQLLGYLLADTNDAYAIQRVGVVALRWRNAISWTTEEYLLALGAAEGISLAEWRVRFAELLAPLDARRRRQPRRGNSPMRGDLPGSAVHPDVRCAPRQDKHHQCSSTLSARDSFG